MSNSPHLPADLQAAPLQRNQQGGVLPPAAVAGRRPGPARSLRIAACLLAMTSSGPGWAADSAYPGEAETVVASRGEPASGIVGAAPVVRIGANEQNSTRRVELAIGRSLVVELPRDAKEVFVAAPKVANAVVRSTRKVFIIGLENGTTSIFILDTEGRQIAALEVVIGRDLNILLQTLRRALPQANIDLKPAGDSILMTGMVNSAAEAQQATDIANAFVGVSGGLFGATKGAVINGLTIKGKDQVMLRVTVVEVGRAVLKQFGVSTSGTWSAFNAFNGATFPLSPQTLAVNNGITAGISNGNFSANALVNAFERAGVSRVLAEPTLVAISGESATFTAGGEVPVPKTQDCVRVAGAPPQCQIGVEFKPYGINLTFTPVVMSENRINLRINTEVTELDYENQVRFEVINVPGIKVRKSSTSVELPSGATMMTAGLLSQNMGHAVSGTPGLMNLPVLGALFRSRDYQRRETELMIMVSPVIAKPMEPSQVARPDDGFVEAHDAQGILLGRLNRLYGVAGAPPAAASFKGRFGFITE